MSVVLFRESKVLEEELALLNIVGGYDSVRLPGGTSKDGRHSGFIEAWYYDHIQKEKYLLVVTYKSDYHLSESVILIDEKENPKLTAVREAKEEIGVKFIKAFLKLRHKIIVGSNTIINEKHEKYFFRYIRSLDISKLNENFLEGTGEVGPFLLINKSLVKKYLFKKHYDAIK